MQLDGSPHLSRGCEERIIFKDDVQVKSLGDLGTRGVIQDFSSTLAQQEHVSWLKGNEEPFCFGVCLPDRLSSCQLFEFVVGPVVPNELVRRIPQAPASNDFACQAVVELLGQS